MLALRRRDHQAEPPFVRSIVVFVLVKTLLLFVNEVAAAAALAVYNNNKSKRNWRNKSMSKGDRNNNSNRNGNGDSNDNAHGHGIGNGIEVRRLHDPFSIQAVRFGN